MGSFETFRHNKHKRKELIAHCDDLTRAAGMDHGPSIDEWEESMPQEMRDELAARALIFCEGDGVSAAARLGFRDWPRGYSRSNLQRVFGTPGVQAILMRDLASPEESRSLMIERQVKIALYGKDQESTRAFHALALVCGWKKSPDVLVQNNRQTILAMVTQKDGRGELTGAVEVLPSFLEHEPGAAVRIDSGDASIASVLRDEI